MAKELGADTQFIYSDIYELPNVLDDKFDIVFTSYGVIGWLPDMGQWAKIVAHYLKPGGKFIMVEFHPVVWMFGDDFSSIDYGYFKGTEIIEQLEGSYADQNAKIRYSTVTWTHSLSEVINSLIQSGIHLTGFEEYDYSPYNCFKHLVQIDKGKYRIKHLSSKLPMIYAITGVIK